MGWADAFGSITSAAINAFSQHKTNRTSKNIAQANNETEMDYVNSAHQREVADLKLAGLNPILSAGGSGAATPNLDQPNLTAPQFDAAMVTNTINSLADSKLKNAQAELTQKEQTRIDAQNMVDAAHTKLMRAQTIQTEIDNKSKDAKNKAEINKLKQERDKLIYEADEINARIDNTLTNTAGQKIQNSKLNEQLTTQIDNLKSQTDYNRERARGYSKSRNYGGEAGGSIGIKGPFGLKFNASGNIGGNYGKSDTW